MPSEEDFSSYVEAVVSQEIAVPYAYERINLCLSDFDFFCDHEADLKHARVAFFVCRYAGCPGKYKLCYHSAEVIPEKYKLIAEYAERLEDSMQSPYDYFHQRDGLFSLLCGKKKYYKFPVMPDYEDEVKSAFCAIYNDLDFTISDWDTSKRKTSLLGTVFWLQSQISSPTGLHAILSIESNYENKRHVADRINDMCEAGAPLLCGDCFADAEVRLGCQRSYPRIKEFFQNILLNWQMLQKFEIMHIQQPCPLLLQR